MLRASFAAHSHMSVPLTDTFCQNDDISNCVKPEMTTPECGNPITGIRFEMKVNHGKVTEKQK